MTIKNFIWFCLATLALVIFVQKIRERVSFETLCHFDPPVTFVPIDSSTHFRNTGKMKTDEIGHPVIKYLVIHSTANDSSFANRVFHATYIDTNHVKTSWHYTIDDTGITQHFTDSLRCFHSSSKKINETSLGIELCEYQGMDSLATVLNLQHLLRILIPQYPGVKVIYHDEVPQYDKAVNLHKKRCPRLLSPAHRKLVISSVYESITKVGLERPYHLLPWR